MNEVAIVGASGFVGRVLTRTIERDGGSPVPVVRSIPELMQEGGGATLARTAGSTGRYRTVINLAYPTDGPPYTYPDQNERIFETVDGILEDGGHLVHVSTQAVFGPALEREVVVGAAPARRDDAYVEAKQAAEEHFSRRAADRGWAVDIVRPGNIWGRGSGAWGVPLVHRLVTGRPVGVAGRPGFSNATDIENLSSCLSFLAREDADSVRVRYHHVAEFSNVRWDEWIAPLADALEVAPVYADSAALESPPMPTPISQLRDVYRQLAVRPVSGSRIRTGLRLMPDRLRARLKGPYRVSATVDPLQHDERMYLRILATQREFRSSVIPGWEPPVSREHSLEQFLEWALGPAL